MMPPANRHAMFRATIIISIYKDVEALDLILHALSLQTCRDFEILVSEDGEDPSVAAYMAGHISSSVQHLTQPDIGFRKNRALNRAILAARSDNLIFIDGDCVPHPAFIESHLKVVKPGVTATGRRVELGPDFSTRLRKHQLELADFVRPMNYLRSIPALKRDGTKNYEYGLHYPLLQWLSEKRTIRLVGCNLSIHRDDLLKINGFNEEYQSPGIGEDSDIDWRLQMAGVTIRNVKFSAVQYHLYHPRSYTVSDRNMQLLRESQQTGRYICTHGISEHQRN
ncbi:MAG TPA: glycosyltransferase [Gammaproteobacteria bacterium]